MEQTGSGGEHPSPFVRGNGGGPCCHLSMVVVGPHHCLSIVMLGAGGCSWTFITIHRSLVLGSWVWLGGVSWQWLVYGVSWVRFCKLKRDVGGCIPVGGTHLLLTHF